MEKLNLTIRCSSLFPFPPRTERCRVSFLLECVGLSDTGNKASELCVTVCVREKKRERLFAFVRENERKIMKGEVDDI